jgi:polar amino acid transport system substrate-binding protein
MIPRLLAPLLLALLLLAGRSVAPAAAEPLRAGWYAGEPQQFIQRSEGQESLTGLDIEMVRAIAARAGHAVAFEPMDYPSLMQAVMGGTRDLATGVAFTPDRAVRARLSAAYRHDVNVLILRDADLPRIRGTDAAGLLADLRRDAAFRLGVRAGFSYIDPALDALIADPAEAARIRPAGSDAENLQRLLAGEIDGFIAERLSVALLIARRGARHLVEEASPRLPVPLHLMFSPATPPETVAAFDAAIEALRADGTLGATAARFRLPVLLSLTLGSDWFFALEMLGTVAAALAGYLAARQDRYSLFGALVLAGVTAVAAGVLRDLVVGRHPVGIAGSPAYLSVAFGTAILCYLLGHLWAALRGRAVLAFTLAQGVVWVRRRGLDRLLFEAADAVALAAFAVIGVAVALGMGVQPLWLWGPILGTLTGAGGGILRDIVRGGGHVATLRDTLYAEVALLVAVALSLYLTWRIGEIEQDEMLAVVAVAVAGGGLLRMCVVLFGWRPLRLP